MLEVDQTLSRPNTYTISISRLPLDLISNAREILLQSPKIEITSSSCLRRSNIFKGPNTYTISI